MGTKCRNLVDRNLGVDIRGQNFVLGRGWTAIRNYRPNGPVAQLDRAPHF